MEEPSNGKIEETQVVETLEEEAEVAIKEVEVLKPQVEPAAEIVLDGNSEASQEEVEKMAITPSLETSEATEVLVEELGESIEAVPVDNSDSVEVVKKEIEDKYLLSVDEIGVTEEGNILVKNGLPEAVTVSRDVAEGVVVDTVLEEKAMQTSGNGSEEVVKSVEKIVQQSTNTTVVGSSDAIPNNAENTPIISLSQRTGTSWRSCCGLLEVLGRSNR